MVGNITEVMQSMRNDYPLLEKAIKEALQTLLQQRPADPVLFVAEKLREVNRENRIEMVTLQLLSEYIRKHMIYYAGDGSYQDTGLRA
ncbi:hypothetical protein GUITHDRAFT_151477 [Guillardia theta CCMP2712]|uniref:Uncharacterized protein n=1 Tax=Guillardia theta (strain CCMP2712) TaxID=905079 RepID=L1JM36_GUITC|nr:hypothetical protein GUITHDRAFT_151477 [Guillardia theta CCMP2712]EKX49230.1 hypothetical protein GUITHDRAFT_151477 [Guillardia theta CCMP2712]|eukprot:XP_005836210.1 hypothetical protein GUITHDRAFT_151477 [Guillardia theta CCMP2712]